MIQYWSNHFHANRAIKKAQKHLTAKDGRGQVLHARDSGGQPRDDAHDPVEEGGVGGHRQDRGLAAADLGSLHHHAEAHAEKVGPPQGGHHSPTHEPARLGNKIIIEQKKKTFSAVILKLEPPIND